MEVNEQGLVGHAGLIEKISAWHAGFFSVLADAVVHRSQILRDPVRRVFLKQIYFTGIEALPLLALAALMGGFFTTAKLNQVLGQEMGVTIEVVRFLLVQEGAVLTVSLFLLARSGSAIAAELAAGARAGEISALYRMGINPGAYLVAPRVIAFAVCVAALTLFFQLILVFGGFALMALIEGWDYVLALERFSRGIQPGFAAINVIRSFVFGALIGGIACLHGLRAVSGPRGIPVATRSTFVHGFAAIILADSLFVWLMGDRG